ncbi:MAG: translation initiation factor IF-2, partial [Flavobacteriaceae bacterium]|nr:translation initiation factor IF-2 [Flavobacteriaceae bacterium]
MADTNNLRLNKVLRELNISLDRAVEFLSKKGYDIEARPTTKISSEVYNVLLDEFQVDKSKKVASKEVGEEKRKEKEEILRIAHEKELEKKRLEEEAKKEIFKTESEREIHIKTVGKIDIEPKKPEKKEEPKEVKEEPVVEKEQVEEVKEEPVVAEKEPVKEVKPKPEEPERPEEPEKIETKYQKLTGPKQVGEKIDLKQFEKPKKKEEKKEKPSENRTEKRKRKRINKPPIKSNSFQQRDFKPGDQNKGKGRKHVIKEEPSEEEVQKQVRETLEKLQGKTTKSKAAKYRREKREMHRKQTEMDIQQQEAESKVLKATEFVTASELATMMDVSVTQIISACMSLGMMVTMNQRLDAETLTIVAEEFGYEVEFVSSEVEEAIEEVVDEPEDLKPRAPIVTVMGHVDHGKTSLLDYIRKTNVIAGESGGITQHIGAYSVEVSNGQKITFLDTPGHEAFTAMRARGAQITDIVIIVIAADDSIMPQTKEAISHAQAAGVPIVFAINKIDKPNANPEKVKEELAGMNLLVEDWGGKIQSHDISAKTGLGVGELLEKVMLEAELLDLKANPDKNATGTIIEALLDKGKGYVATILVEAGTLRIGDYLLAGRHSGKVKAMHDERGNIMKEAGPSAPVSILGLDGAPQAGDKFRVFDDEREAKQIAAKRDQLQREQSVRTQRHITLDEIGRRIALGDFKELNIILKG